MDYKRLISWAGTLLMLLSLVFIARQLMSYGAEFSGITASIAAGLALVVVLEAFTIILASFNYQSLILNISGVKVGTPLALAVYTISNLYKYIPGGVLYVAGRNRLAVEIEELSHAKVALATVLEGVLFVVTSTALIILLVYDNFVSYLNERDLITALPIVLSAVVFAAAAILYLFRRRIKDLIQSMDELWYLTAIKRLLNTFVLMALWGASFAATVAIMGQSLSLSLFTVSMGVYLIAWLAGYLTPGAPSGLGIREVVLLMFLGGILDENLLISALVIHRMLSVLGDVAAYAAALIYSLHLSATPNRL